MSQLVLTLTEGPPESATTTEIRSRTPAIVIPSRDVIILGTVLGVLQVLDGILTAVGVHTFGLHAEANLIIRHAMAMLGTVPALVILKVLALAIIVILCAMAERVRWLKFAMRGVAALYLVAAIVPWSTILALKYLS